MIQGVYGCLGNGKSYFMVDEILRYVAAGGCVFTNIDMQPDPWFNPRYGVMECGYKKFLREAYDWEYQEGQIYLLNRDNLLTFHREVPKGTVQKPVLVVIDEASEWFDSYTDNREGMMEMFTFLKHSRKANIDIYFLAQDFTMLQKRIRDFCEWHWHCVNMQGRPVPGTSFKFPFPFFTFNRYDRTDRMFQDRKWRKKSKGVFGSYKTEECFRELNLRKDPYQTTFTNNRRRKQMNKFERMVLLLALALGGYASFRSFVGKSTAAAAPVELAKMIAVKQAEALAPRPVSAPKVLSESFGWIKGNGREFVMWRGGMFKVGDTCPEGMIYAISQQQIEIDRLNGEHVTVVCGGQSKVPSMPPAVERKLSEATSKQNATGEPAIASAFRPRVQAATAGAPVAQEPPVLKPPEQSSARSWEIPLQRLPEPRPLGARSSSRSAGGPSSMPPNFPPNQK